MYIFKIGDKVKSTEDGYSDLSGRIGEVIECEDQEMIGVDWGAGYSGHDCGGLITSGTGWYCNGKNLKLISESMSKKTKAKKSNKERYYFIEIDEDGKPVGNCWSTESEVTDDVYGGEQIVKVKVVDEFDAVEETIKLVPRK